MTRSHFPASSTPFPNSLLDVVMPTLSDTEWRLLCVVVRATLGWQDEAGGRKQQDWLTHSQLKARTGRSSEAVCRALDALVRQGLLSVQDEAGTALNTPHARRSHRGRLCFRLGAAAGVAGNPAPVQGERVDTATTISESEMSIPKTESRIPENETKVLESASAKAKTTKETLNKTTPDGVRASFPKGGGKPVENSRQTRADPEAKSGASVFPSDVQRFLQAYRERFAERSARGEPPPLAWERDSRLVKGLLAQYGLERLLELLEGFFQSEDAWVRKRGYALACFPTLLPMLLMEDSTRPARPAPATHVEQHRADAPPWQHGNDIATSSQSLFERYPHLRDRPHRPPP